MAAMEVEYWWLERRGVGGEIVVMLGGGRNCGARPSWWGGRSDRGIRLKGFMVDCSSGEGGVLVQFLFNVPFWFLGVV